MSLPFNVMPAIWLPTFLSNTNKIISEATIIENSLALNIINGSVTTVQAIFEVDFATQWSWSCQGFDSHHTSFFFIYFFWQCTIHFLYFSIDYDQSQMGMGILKA